MFAMSEVMPYVERPLNKPDGWLFYASESQPTRLVVFVHGFGGQAVDTWQQFPDGALVREWWRLSDLLFVGYDSARDNILGVANRLRQFLPLYYPRLPSDLLNIGDVSLRDGDTEYKELVIVGHSLGGVVIRRALLDVAWYWRKACQVDPSVARPPLLDASVYLFSPASAGFRPGGWLGMLKASRAWSLVEMQLRRSSAYTDLQPDSDFLATTRMRTEKLVSSLPIDLLALQPRVVWAQPDDVVLTECYDSDRSCDSIDGTNHRSVCKPRRHATKRLLRPPLSAYPLPWLFVETGRIE
jgi:pimeloyl-ACP methyl ester carboxylesterase